jgi:hypothetical protein
MREICLFVVDNFRRKIYKGQLKGALEISEDPSIVFSKKDKATLFYSQSFIDLFALDEESDETQEAPILDMNLPIFQAIQLQEQANIGEEAPGAALSLFDLLYSHLSRQGKADHDFVSTPCNVHQKFTSTCSLCSSRFFKTNVRDLFFDDQECHVLSLRNTSNDLEVQKLRDFIAQ